MSSIKPRMEERRAGTPPRARSHSPAPRSATPPRPLVIAPAGAATANPIDVAHSISVQFNSRLSDRDRFFTLPTVAHAEAWSVYNEVFHSAGCCLAAATVPPNPLRPPALAQPVATPLELAALAAALDDPSLAAQRGAVPAPRGPPPRATDASFDLLAACSARWGAAAEAAVAAAGEAPPQTLLVPLVLQRATGGRVVVAVRVREVAAPSAPPAISVDPPRGSSRDLYAMLGMPPPSLRAAPSWPPPAPAPQSPSSPLPYRQGPAPPSPRSSPPATARSPALTLRGSSLGTEGGAETSARILQLKRSVEALDARLVTEMGVVAFGDGLAGGGRGGGSFRSASLSASRGRSRSPAVPPRTPRIPGAPVGASPPMSVLSPQRRR